MSTATTDTPVFFTHGGPADLPMVDAVLLYDLICWAEADAHDLVYPKYRGWGTYDQGSWSVTDQPDLTDEERQELRNGACRTSYCIAGQAVNQADFRIVYRGRSTAELCIQQEETGRTTRLGRPILRDVPGARERHIDLVAREVIGLTEEEGDALFSGGNDIDNLKRYANTFMLARALPPLFPGQPVELIDRGSCWDYWMTDEDDPDDY